MYVTKYIYIYIYSNKIRHTTGDEIHNTPLILLLRDMA